MGSILEVLIQHQNAFLAGLRVTFSMAAAVWLLGLAAGTALGLAGSRYKRSIGRFTRLASFVLSGIPVLVLLFWMHYPLQTLVGIVVAPIYTVVAALAVMNTIAVADVVRAAVLSFPDQYVAAGKVTGMTRSQIFTRIQLPIILRTVLPPLLILQVNMLHMTLFGSLISVDEIFRVAQSLNAQFYKPIPIYSALAFFFLVVSLPLNGLAEGLKARFGRDLSER